VVTRAVAMPCRSRHHSGENRVSNRHDYVNRWWGGHPPNVRRRMAGFPAARRRSVRLNHCVCMPRSRSSCGSAPSACATRMLLHASPEQHQRSEHAPLGSDTRRDPRCVSLGHPEPVRRHARHLLLLTREARHQVAPRSAYCKPYGFRRGRWQKHPGQAAVQVGRVPLQR
jgi:hypothetical protein